MKKLFISNAEILCGNTFLKNCGMLVKDGKIADFCAEAPSDCEVTDACGKLVIPGFIDIHVHGGGGSDFMDGTLQAFRTVSKTHCLCGTTSMCPTTVACPPKVLYGIFETYKQFKVQSEYSDFLGVHLEGPFISEQMKGAQNPNFIIAPQKDLLEQILEKGKDVISRISLAPELEGMDSAIPKIKEFGAVLAIAHSNADCQQTINAFNMGVNLITHLYCSTPSVRKINQKLYAGIVEAYYLLDNMKAELIGDGCHVPKEVICMVNKLKSAKNVCLITDAMRAAGTNAKESYLGAKIPENRVIIEKGVAKLPDRSSFAGSIATMDKVFKNAVCNAKLPIETVSQMMSLTPAEIMGADKYKGVLNIGYDADFLIIDSEYNVEKVFVRGECKK